MRFVLISGILLIFGSIFIVHNSNKKKTEKALITTNERFWKIQSIDTMKFSRDTAREKLPDQSFDKVIEQQVKDIASTGATHVAIATPYDEEFLPFLKRWVAAARRNNLGVWYRGNLSGWEEWFDYDRIDRETHKQLIQEFILNNPELFEDGDIFVSCPECENGGPGDPRFNGDAEGHKRFLIEEYNLVKEAFKTIDKDVTANYYSMNGDVARLIMDRETTAALDGAVSIDHYVNSSEKLITDIHAYAEQSGGKVVLGEWGAPIPDINGEMTEQQQADFIDETFQRLLESPDIEAINYWVNRGGSTELWKSEGNPKLGVAALTKYFKPFVLRGTVTDKRGNPIQNATIMTKHKTVKTEDGHFAIPIMQDEQVTIQKADYQQVVLSTNASLNSSDNSIILEKTNPSFTEKLLNYFSELFSGAK